MTYRYALLALTTALITGVAFGHAELEGSTPDDGETLLTAPSDVALVFSESVELAFSTFKVYPLPSELAATAADPSAIIGFDDTDDTNESADDLEDDSSDEGDDTSDDSTSSDSATGSDDSASMDGDDHNEVEHSHSDDTATAAFVSDALAATGDEGERVDEDVTSQGSEVTLTLQDDLPAGAYVAMWKALSSDGHTVEGYLTFSYQP